MLRPPPMVASLEVSFGAGRGFNEEGKEVGRWDSCHQPVEVMGSSTEFYAHAYHRFAKSPLSRGPRDLRAYLGAIGAFGGRFGDLGLEGLLHRGIPTL